MKIPTTGNEIRQSFIDFFIEKGHTYVPSASLVPGGDQTLLFTNAGMVQFKDVFLGTDKRPYTRAVNSQKCMRVAGKHNDLDEVGRDNTHHTFFEMLGNWSFGDYYKKEAIAWAWELLTERWGLDKAKLWVTVFKDERNEIPTDEEAARSWAEQPGIDKSHIVYSGRKDNFWEMADVGPCGPCSEIHIELGPEYCNKRDEPGHVCKVNGDCTRIVEFWNLVFIQYNRLDVNTLEPLPATHVDTGMGLERITSIIQKVYSNYETDLLFPLMDQARKIANKTREEMREDLTPYRVIADHGRAAAFLIADGVVPGNVGRNYICRMIIRRASRFGASIGLNEPFLSQIARVVIEGYGDAYPELKKNQKAILDSITREESQFHRTLASGLEEFQSMIKAALKDNLAILPGEQLFNLYATHGVPLEISRDLAHEAGYEVDETGFRDAMEQHRLASGSGKAFGAMGGDEVEEYRQLVGALIKNGKLPVDGVQYDPYTTLQLDVPLLMMINNGQEVERSEQGDEVDLIFPKTSFYLESGGQVADTGTFVGEHGIAEIINVRKPASGVIVHHGKVTEGFIQTGERGKLGVDLNRRQDIARNHTATHLLHAALHQVIGEEARQAGSLVAPGYLRFDFNHPRAMSQDEIQQVQDIVNAEILAGDDLKFETKKLADALQDGATALFGEKYGDEVRTVAVSHQDKLFSLELCGGTHVSSTSDIGVFLITSEGSAASGIQRIEAVTGRRAYELIKLRTQKLQDTASLLDVSLNEVPERVELLLHDLDDEKKKLISALQETARQRFQEKLDQVAVYKGIPYLTIQLPPMKADILRTLADLFRSKYPNGLVVLGTSSDDRPLLVAALSQELVKKGLSASDLVRYIAPAIGGSGGGRPDMAQAGGKDVSRLDDALNMVKDWLEKKITD